MDLNQMRTEKELALYSFWMDYEESPLQSKLLSFFEKRGVSCHMTSPFELQNLDSPPDFLLVSEAQYFLYQTQSLNSSTTLVLIRNMGQDVDRPVPTAPYWVDYSMEESATLDLILLKSLLQFKRPQFCGLSRFFDTEKIFSKVISSSQDRDQTLKEVQEFFVNSQVRQANLEKIRSAVDEILMNAIYDAPYDAKHGPLYNHLSRKETVQLRPTEQPLLQLYADDEILAISVADPFGSLTFNTLKKYLDMHHNPPEIPVQESQKGGGGFGFHMILSMVNFMLVNVDPNRKTEITAFIFRSKRPPELSGASRFQCFFNNIK